MRFPSGQIVVTRSIHIEMEENSNFYKFVHQSIQRHLQGDWGDTCEEDKEANEVALKEGGRLFSVYKSDEFGKIWIITEADRSATTVLRPDDY